MVTNEFSPMQEKYIWLAGSFKHMPVLQGVGKRSKRLKYGFTEKCLVLFGYCSPMEFLLKRGYFENDPGSNSERQYRLTQKGIDSFQLMLARGKGFYLNSGIEKVSVQQK